MEGQTERKIADQMMPLKIPVALEGDIVVSRPPYVRLIHTLSFLQCAMGHY